MKTILALALATTLAGTLSACGVAYEDRQTAYAAEHRQVRYYSEPTQVRYYSEPAYYQPAYFPERTYSSRYDYYRHYNGIDG